eukprot:gene18271-25711_t
MKSRGTNSTTQKSDEIFGVNISVKYLKKIDLINYLNTLHTCLTSLSQNVRDRPKGLVETSKYLLSPKIIKHIDKDVRLLAACCCADILRIFAPEEPYQDEDTINVFQLIIAQLRGLSTYDADTGI